MARNPNNLGPRTMRDCTFQDWADPIECHKTERVGMGFYGLVALCVMAAAAIVWFTK